MFQLSSSIKCIFEIYGPPYDLYLEIPGMDASVLAGSFPINSEQPGSVIDCVDGCMTLELTETNQRQRDCQSNQWDVVTALKTKAKSDPEYHLSKEWKATICTTEECNTVPHLKCGHNLQGAPFDIQQINYLADGPNYPCVKIDGPTEIDNMPIAISLECEFNGSYTDQCFNWIGSDSKLLSGCNFMSTTSPLAPYQTQYEDDACTIAWEEESCRYDNCNIKVEEIEPLSYLLLLCQLCIPFICCVSICACICCCCCSKQKTEKASSSDDKRKKKKSSSDKKKKKKSSSDKKKKKKKSSSDKKKKKKKSSS